MAGMKINIVGGGPAGLYFGILMKKADPRHDITILERDGPNDTFGWGIVFSDKMQSYLRDHDAESHARITAKFQLWDNVDVIHRGVKTSIGGNRFAGIGRLAFLNIFHERCRELGVRIEFQHNVGPSGLDALQDCDLFIGADGANSLVRRHFAGAFQPTVDVRRNRYIWLGTQHLFTGLTLTFKQHDTGVYAAHSYRFSESHSTFIVECPDATWNAAGFADMDDERACVFLADVFRDELCGRPLLSNNFVKWLRFPIVKNARWIDDHRVLLGDALHTAHFSIGSGTRLALEDAIALYQAIRNRPSVPAALAEFERARKPVVDELQEAALSSLLWFENFGDRLHLDPLPFAYEIMTRSGRIDHEGLRQRDPKFVAAYERWRADHAANEPRNS